MRGTGYQKLWGWFGLSYASFCVMPRILMHEMPDDWQAKMADLLEQFDATFRIEDLPACKVMPVGEKGKFSSWPDWLLHYRRPELARVNALRRAPCETCGTLAYECVCVSALNAPAAGGR